MLTSCILLCQMTAWYAARACEVDRSSGQLVIAAGVLAQGGSSTAGASDGKYKLSVELRQLQESLTSGALAIKYQGSGLYNKVPHDIHMLAKMH